MGLFTRRKEQGINAGQERLAERIANYLLGTQRRSAAWLNTRASKLGHKNSILILIFLGLGFGVWCLYLVLSPLL